MMMKTTPSTYPSASPAAKRRKLPASFFRKPPPLKLSPNQAVLVRAAVCIQRFVRLRKVVSSLVDPILQSPVVLREAVKFVEPGGVEHWFNSSSLSQYFLATASFCNPLSRRILWFWEVMNVVQKQPKNLRSILIATYKARDFLQKDAREHEGSDTFSAMEDMADESLQAILEKAELCFCSFTPSAVEGSLSTYEDDLLDICEADPARAVKVCIRHSEVVCKRGLLCPLELKGEFQDIHDKIIKKYKSAVSAPVHKSILAAALARRMSFT